jgi:hypothetical protein
MLRRSLLSASGLILALGSSVARAEEKAPLHRISLQISSSDPAVMNLALTNIVNIARHYEGTGESVAIDLTAFGPGYTLVRADTSPVRERIAQIKARYPFVRLSACQNARRAVAEAEGKAVGDIPQIPEAQDVPAGVVHLSELQEQGWSYLRP